MQINIATLDEFDQIARKMNYVPQSEVLAKAQQFGQQIARNVLEKAGFKVEDAPQAGDVVPLKPETPVELPADSEPPAQEVLPPAEKPKSTRGRKPNPPAPAADPRQVDIEEFAKQGAPPEQKPAVVEDKIRFPEGDDGNAKKPVDPEMKTYTHDDVRAALRDLAANIHLDASRALLKHFGATKAADVPADKIAEVVAASKTEAKTVEAYAAELKAKVKA